MGCSCLNSGKPGFPEEGEGTIQQFEASLGFSELSVDVCISSLQDTTRKEGLTLPLVKSWLTSLGISPAPLDIPSHPIANLYSSFLEKNRYPTQKLGTLAILLCEGSVPRKAAVLYRLYNRKNNSFNGPDILNLVSLICDLSLTHLPKLAESQLIMLRDTAALHKLHQHMNKFCGCSDLLIKNMRRQFLAVEFSACQISETEFVEVLVGKMPSLVSSREMRSYACDTIPRLLRQQSALDEVNSSPQMQVRQMRRNTLMPTSHAYLALARLPNNQT